MRAQKTAVIGLGIIGASVSRSLVRAGYFVAGSDRDESTLAFALEKGYVSEAAKDLTEYDAVFLAVPPQAAIGILQESRFKDGAFVADLCGVKGALEKVVFSEPRNYRYIGLHPMAGKETSGIASSSGTLFDGANLVIVTTDETDPETLEEAKEYAAAMSFGRITVCGAAEHDEKIALTSQLAHIVSNAYVKSPTAEDCEGFTGGSFQDMTRIAGVDEQIWSQLYLLNGEALLRELDGLIGNLREYRDAVADGDERRLKEVLRAGRRRWESIKGGKN